MRISHRVTTPADPEVVWSVLEDPTRWREFELLLARVEGSRGRVREGQHLMAVSRWLPVRIPVDVRLVATGRRLGLTVHALPGLREQIEHSVTARPRGGSEVRVSTVLEGPLGRLAVVPVWLATGVTTRLLGRRVTREHRRIAAADGARSGVA